tara:strand:+ start:9007 stop:9288 length:282 start_codon:yes stop_codon:yes gene_type:complete
MGGPTCKSEEERIQRRRASALKSYHKCKNKPGYLESRRVINHKASKKYYHLNKEKCKSSVIEWRIKNMEKVKQYNQRAYYKRKYGKEVFFIKI